MARRRTSTSASRDTSSGTSAATRKATTTYSRTIQCTRTATAQRRHGGPWRLPPWTTVPTSARLSGAVPTTRSCSTSPRGASTLQSLRVTSYYDVSSKAFTKLIKKFPLLEELELVFKTDAYSSITKRNQPSNNFWAKLLQSTCEACSHASTPFHSAPCWQRVARSQVL
ncbi:hypothetical protein ACP70R_018854 [Stipagrostis hirtigluma subsp. patula]